jgi:hypothetical protein
MRNEYESLPNIHFPANLGLRARRHEIVSVSDFSTPFRPPGCGRRERSEGLAVAARGENRFFALLRMTAFIKAWPRSSTGIPRSENVAK